MSSHLEVCCLSLKCRFPKLRYPDVHVGADDQKPLWGNGFSTPSGPRRGSGPVLGADATFRDHGLGRSAPAGGADGAGHDGCGDQPGARLAGAARGWSSPLPSLTGRPGRLAAEEEISWVTVASRGSSRPRMASRAGIDGTARRRGAMSPGRPMVPLGHHSGSRKHLLTRSVKRAATRRIRSLPASSYRAAQESSAGHISATMAAACFGINLSPLQ